MCNSPTWNHKLLVLDNLSCNIGVPTYFTTLASCFELGSVTMLCSEWHILQRNHPNVNGTEGTLLPCWSWAQDSHFMHDLDLGPSWGLIMILRTTWELSFQMLDHFAVQRLGSQIHGCSSFWIPYWHPRKGLLVIFHQAKPVEYYEHTL
jgi:hypothetical protein